MAKPKRPRDANQLAVKIVKIATDENEKKKDTTSDSSKNQAALTMGKLGGRKGGKARAEKLTPDRRKEIAKKAAEKRWRK